MTQKPLKASVEHSLGKGKVVSSILTGSTIKINHLRDLVRRRF
jgi:hypothetical protein